MRKVVVLTALLLLMTVSSRLLAQTSAWHINAGGSDYTAVDSTLFVADKAYTAGDFGYGVAGRTFSFSSAVAGTDDDTLYQTMRAGYNIDYQFDVPDGEYDVTLYFMEPWQSAAGEREFDVTIEGTVVLDNYDIFAVAGAQYTAVTETITTNVTDGQLNIAFDRISRVALVSAISVESTVPPTPEPEITVSPTSLAFGDVENGSDSDMTVTITNDGTADLTVSSLTSSDAAFTVVSPTAPVVIAAGNSEVVTVRFSPTATGAYSGSLDIASDDADEPTVSVALSGSGIEPPLDEPDIAVSPTALDFGSVTTGSTADLTVTIDNVGTQLLTVSSLTISGGEFSVVSPTAPFDVAAGASDVVTVRFSPTADGVQSEDLTINSNDPDEGSVVVSLTGEGVSTPAVAYRINVGGSDYTDTSGNLFVADKAYTAGDFGYSGSVRTFSFSSEIANTDDDALYQVMNAGLSVTYLFDLANGDYDVTFYFMEPWQSAAGERTFDVTMEDTLVLDNYDIFVAAGGQYTAVNETIPVTVSDGQLNIQLDRVNRYAMVSAIAVVSDGGTTNPAPEISVSPISLAYGNVISGTTSDLTVTINNVGTADLNVSSLTTTNTAFSVVSPTAPVVIPAGGNEVVTVRFSPTAVTAYSGSLDIASDDADEPTVSVALSGDGIVSPPDEPDINVTPASVSFGSVIVGNSSDQIVTIENVGTLDLNVSALSTTNGDFTVVSPTAPVVVPASGSQAVTVRFTPSSPGAASGDLTIISDDPDEGTVIVGLSGTGTSSSGTTYSEVTSIVGISAPSVQHPSICDKPPMGSGSGWGDYDNDGDVDVYMTNHGGANYLYRNDGDTNSDGLPDFTNVAASMGVQNASDLSLSAVFIDYDNDGDQDLYVTNWDGNSLFENQLIETGSVSFVDVAASAGVVDAGRAITSGWADFNNDGWLDLYVAKHRRCAGDPQAEDHLYQSNGDGTFTNVSSYLCGGASTCAQLVGLGFTPGWFDYDNDGDQDLYLVNDDIGGAQYPNVLWRNDGPDGSGGWLFTDVSAASGLDVSLNGMGLGVGDFDNDGFFDVAFSNIAPGRLMHNNGDGTFSDISGSSGVTAVTSAGTWGTAFFDYDNDADVDLYFVSGGVGSQTSDHPNFMMSNDGNGATFTDVSAASGLDDTGWGRSASMVDFDGDGFVDIVVGNYLDGYYLYHNDSVAQGSSNHWLTITVEGTESNRDGIGTRISITSGGVTQIREISSGPTHGGGDYRAAYFGLDNETSANVTIQWPNGVVENLGSVSADQAIHRTEPSSNPPDTTFVDVTGTVGMNVPHTLSSTVCAGPPLGTGTAWADYDNDGDIDVFVVNSGAANWLYRNDGDGNSDGLPDYTDVASAAGVDDPAGVSHSAVFIDYDNDGDQDLYVTNWDDGTAAHGNILYENQLIESGSATFTDVTATAGLADDGRAITSGWADFDQDGYLDVYLAKHTACGSDPAAFLQDHLYHNNGDGTFTDVSQYLCTSTGGVLPCPADIEGRGFMPGWFDMDNDGDQDLYLVNDWNASTNENRLWRNDGPDGSGGWLFVEISAAADARPAEVNGMGLSIGDPNNDGWLDLSFSDVGLAWLLLNDQDGTFTDVSGSAGLPAGVTWGTAFFDYDNDGWEDLFLAGGSIHDPNNNPEDTMLRNRGGEGFIGTFDDVSAATGLNHNGRGRAVSIVDFDQDGYVDLMVGNYGEDYRLYHNESTGEGNTNHWLTITLEGTTSNRDAIGARLTLTTNDGTQIREINSGWQHGGGSFKAAYFGLGSETSGTLEIRWPDGTTQVIGTVTADQTLHFVEP